MLHSPTFESNTDTLSNFALEDGYLNKSSIVQVPLPIKKALNFTSLFPTQVEGLWDKAIHWTLSQVVYRTLEPPNPSRREASFDTPDPTDLIYLLWVGGKAVGFCTLKPKGEG